MTAVVKKYKDDQFIEDQISKFTVSDQQLIALNRHLDLHITLGDKDSYNDVYAAHQEVKRYRSAVNADSKMIKGRIKKVIAGIDAHKDNLMTTIKPIDEHLDAERKKWDAWKLEKKEEEERKKQAIIQERVTALQTYNATHDPYELGVMDDEAFGYVLTRAKKTWQDAEDQRIEKERIAEEERVAAELQKKKDKIEQDRIKEENEAKAKELEERELAIAKREQALKPVEPKNEVKVKEDPKGEDILFAIRKVYKNDLQDDAKELENLAKALMFHKMPTLKTIDGEKIVQEVVRLLGAISEYILDEIAEDETKS